MRYMVFAGYSYYPSGGKFDVVGVYDEIETALINSRIDAEGGTFDWRDILDLQTGEWVESLGYAHGRDTD